ncbi:MAG: hypothetical protein JW384_01650 [Nitrosomonadaceae bacterium]|nr:hypothetical protein [Nitrosomonadaceae bacterium]
MNPAYCGKHAMTQVVVALYYSDMPKRINS